MKKPKSASMKQQVQIHKKIKEFEKKNPAIAKTLELFEMSMLEYDKVIQSLSPIRTFTSNSTVANSE